MTGTDGTDVGTEQSCWSSCIGKHIMQWRRCDSVLVRTSGGVHHMGWGTHWNDCWISGRACRKVRGALLMRDGAYVLRGSFVVGGILLLLFILITVVLSVVHLLQ
uniref:Transmembrane protein n=1 Tax=Cacopsylla melanoneura TaxID=428564 RepID=A0A8D8ZCU9_9HEMI